MQAGERSRGRARKNPKHIPHVAQSLAWGSIPGPWDYEQNQELDSQPAEPSRGPITCIFNCCIYVKSDLPSNFRVLGEGMNSSLLFHPHKVLGIMKQNAL